MFSFLVSPSHDRGCSLSCANTLFCCSHVSSWEKTEGKEKMDRWGDVALHPNQCNRRPYQTASQSGGREGGDRKSAKQSAHPFVWPPPSRHLFISPSVLSLVLMSCLAIVSPGLFQSNPPPGGHSGGLQGLALIARRHCSRIPRAKHIDALIRPSLLSFCSAKHNLWLPDKSVRNNRRLTINGGTCQGFFSSFFSHLVPKNFSPLA